MPAGQGAGDWWWADAHPHPEHAERLDCGARGQPADAPAGDVLQGHLQAARDERDEDVRLGPKLRQARRSNWHSNVNHPRIQKLPGAANRHVETER